MPGPATLAVSHRPAYHKFGEFCKFAASLRGRFKIRICAVVRRQDRWLESLYAFHVYRGMTRSFDRFAAQMIRRELDWNHYADMLARHGLMDTAIFLSHEAIRHRPIHAWASALLGIPGAALTPTDQISANIRPTPAMLRLFYALNKIGWAKDDLALRQRTRATLRQSVGKMPDAPLSADAIANLLEACGAGVKPSAYPHIVNYYARLERVTFTDRDRAQLLAKYSDANAAFSARFGRQSDFCQSDV